MTIADLRDSSAEQPTAVAASYRWDRWRMLVLGVVLVLLALLLKAADLISVHSLVPGVVLWLISFVPYLAGSLFMLFSRPASGRRQRWELGLILLGAVLLRLLVLFTPPTLSGDAWRYLWDARITLHGYSPYVYVPNDWHLIPFQDPLLYNQMGYHNVPTLYPPGAQALYLISYMLAPDNIFVLKALFLCFDLATCVGLMVLLKRHGLDPARSVIYAWCPLPIVEFATQGHIDSVMLAYVVWMIICAQSSWRGARVATGVLLGLATLTKLYPIVLVLVVLRRRDYALLAACALTIIVGYIPYVILGHGQVFGFFSTYLTQLGGNAGPLLLLIQPLGGLVHVGKDQTARLLHGITWLLLALIIVPTFLLRLRARLSMEAATLITLGAILSVSSFVYPWYVASLIPWIALLLGPLWLRTTAGRRVWQARTLALVGVWYFVCTVDVSYLFLGRTFDWTLYYILIYGVLGLCLTLAIILAIGPGRRMQIGVK
ncbi:MAG TPA: glycosyltransferase 87 family protein [Ktedonobacteraceae bacterium]|nr:glycosyltransferase 87 family protein [Ktedonobacteraceae bacterium]